LDCGRIIANTSITAGSADQQGFMAVDEIAVVKSARVSNPDRSKVNCRQQGNALI
jgi:hypothetical protein